MPGDRFVHLPAADVDVFDEQGVGSLGDHHDRARRADVSKHGSLLLIFVAAKLLGIASQQGGRLDVDRHRQQARVYDDAQQLIDDRLVAGQQNHFAAGRFALADIGRFEKSDFGFGGGKRQSAGRFLADHPFHLRAGNLGHPHVLHEQLRRAEANDGLAAAEIPPFASLPQRGPDRLPGCFGASDRASSSIGNSQRTASSTRVWSA